jgi:hypothetical protein
MDLTGNAVVHRCLQRHGSSRLPAVEGDKPAKKFRRYLVGYFHITAVRTAVPSPIRSARGSPNARPSWMNRA